MLKHKDIKKIVGVSIARSLEYQRKVIFDNVASFTNINNDNLIFESINFEDKYTCGGYGKYNNKLVNIVKKVLSCDGVPLDLTYTGKAFWGMCEYIKENNIKDKNILFIHTGGLPIFFDNLEVLNNK